MSNEKFDFRNADSAGTLVEIVSENGGDNPYKVSAFDSRKDYAILYPNGQFRRIIVDVDGFKKLAK